MNKIISSNEDDCELSITNFSFDGSELRFTYLFTNLTDENVYLFNRLYKLGRDSLTIDSNLCYAEFEDGKIILSKEIKPVPEGLNVYQPNIPYITRIPPGTAFEETLSFILPLQYWTQYQINFPTKLAETPSSYQVWFEIGYFEGTPFSEELIQEIIVNDETINYFYPFDSASQDFLRVGPLPEKIPILLPQN